MKIYLAKNLINGKVYVGQTIQVLAKRRKFHFGVKSNTIFSKAISKYGKENFVFEVIETLTSKEELNEREKYWIKFHKSTEREFGYNMLEGGNSFTMSEEIRKKISAGLKGKKRPALTQEEEFRRKKQGKINTDKRFATPESIQKYLLAFGCKEFNVYEAIQTQKRGRGKPSIFIKGNLVGKWLSSGVCAKDLSVEARHIRSCLSNKRTQHKGYIFEYLKN